MTYFLHFFLIIPGILVWYYGGMLKMDNNTKISKIIKNGALRGWPQVNKAPQSPNYFLTHTAQDNWVIIFLDQEWDWYWLIIDISDFIGRYPFPRFFMHSHFVKKIPSEIKEATRYTLLTPFILFVLFILFKWLYTAQTEACTPV